MDSVPYQVYTSLDYTVYVQFLGGPRLIRPGMIGGAQWSRGCLSVEWSSFILDWNRVRSHDRRALIEMAANREIPVGSLRE